MRTTFDRTQRRSGEQGVSTNRGRALLIIAVVFVLAVGSFAAYEYRSAWRVAHAAAVAIVLGDEISSLGPADPAYRLRLGSPARDEFTITTDPGWFELSRALPINFTVRNTKRPSLPAVHFGVDVELTPSGHWEVIGYGDTGG